MDKREITYYDVSPFASLSAQATPSDNLQPFANVQNLFAEGMNFRSIQTCEHNYTILDGTHNAFINSNEFTQNENIALWSSQQSRYPDRALPSPVTLDISFGGLQSSPGISFNFDTQNNVYADTINVKWYKDNTLLSDKTLHPDSPAYSFSNTVEYYNRVYITFTRLNVPYRYLKIEAIYFGLVRVFGDGEIENLTINEGYDPTNRSIYINSMSFAVNTKDTIPYLFMRRQPLLVKYNVGNVSIDMGRYYIDKSKRYADKRYSIEAIDKIGVLDNTEEFLGGMYINMPSSTVIRQILTVGQSANTLFTFTIDPSLQNVPINGWIPITKRRDALALVALALGAVIDDTRADEIQIKPFSANITSNIPKNKAYRSGSVDIEFPYTGVEVIEHNYVTGGAQKDLYKDTFADEKTVKFSEPMYNLTITNGTIIESGANYAKIRGNGGTDQYGAPLETVLKGYSYIDSQNSVTIRLEYMLEGTEERMMKVEDGYLVNKNISQTVAQRLYDYYQRQQVFDGDFVANLTNTYQTSPVEKIGDIVRIASVFDEDITGQIEKLTLNLGYANIKARGVIRGN